MRARATPANERELGCECERASFVGSLVRWLVQYLASVTEHVRGIRLDREILVQAEGCVDRELGEANEVVHAPARYRAPRVKEHLAPEGGDMHRPDTTRAGVMAVDMDRGGTAS